VKLSVIIVSWNCRDLLARCLDTVFASKLERDFEVIVVDNSSTDGTAAFVQETYPQVKLIANRENAGFARANNLALRQARGELILLLNPDTELQADTLQVMVDFMDKHPECGMAGCKVLNPDGTLQLACRRNIPGLADAFFKLSGLSRLFPRSRRMARYNLTYLPADRVAIVDAVSGSFLMTRRAVMDKIGLLDERFFMYGEDLDWCWRSVRAGYQNYYVPDTSIVHYHGGSSKKRPLRSAYHFYEAMYLFYDKHFAPRWARPLVWLAAMAMFFLGLPKMIWRSRVRRAAAAQGRTIRK
jgi:GT2 family glycosyltransferase